MAYNEAAFGAVAGVGLFRRNQSTGEWFFLSWVNTNQDQGARTVCIDIPGGGPWEFHVLLIRGYGCGPEITVGAEGATCSISVQNAKR